MKVVQLSGGVGGARLARGFAALDDVDLTVVVNVGDDAENHGLAISPDIDTVVYTIAGEEGPYGWGRRGDTFRFNDEVSRFGIDNTFRIGDLDLAAKLFRTIEMRRGIPLSKVTETIVAGFGLGVTVTPVTDDRLRTMVETEIGWLTFQEYFVERRFQDEVRSLRFDGAETALPAPGVVEAIADADTVVIGPSNPPLSIWPILAVPGVREAVTGHGHVTAVSPLVQGRTVKGPAAAVMTSLGLPPGNRGVGEAYAGLIERLVVHETDQTGLGLSAVEVVSTDILLPDLDASRRLAAFLVGG